MTLQNLQNKTNFSKVILGHLQGGGWSEENQGGKKLEFCIRHAGDRYA